MSGPFARGLGGLAGEGERERHGAVSGGEVAGVLGLHPLQVRAQEAFRRPGQHRAAVLLAFAVANDDFVGRGRQRQPRATIWVARPFPGP